jgi:hypothetical protein
LSFLIFQININAEDVCFTIDGKLKMPANTTLSKANLSKIGYSFKINDDVSESEGNGKSSQGTYDLDVFKDTTLKFTISIVKNRIYYIRVYSEAIALIIDTNNNKKLLPIKLSLKDLFDCFGDEWKNYQREEGGTTLIFKKLQNLSFETECSYEPPLETKLKLKEALIKDSCVVCSVLIGGDEGASFK